MFKTAKKNRSLKAVLTTSAAETRKLGERIGKKLSAGDVVALSGGLGAGKTTLIKGIVKGLGSKDEVSSPTYTLIHEYQGREKIYHIDWYRLKNVRSVDRRMAEECLADRAVTLIEWPERGRPIMPKNALYLRIAHAGPTLRKISGKGTL